jgi:excisionase family DNA binding protein
MTRSPHPTGPWLTAQAAAAYLGMTRAALYQSVRRGAVRAYRMGRRIRFRQPELDALFQAGYVVQSAGGLSDGDQADGRRE